MNIFLRLSLSACFVISTFISHAQDTSLFAEMKSRFDLMESFGKMRQYDTIKNDTMIHYNYYLDDNGEVFMIQRKWKGAAGRDFENLVWDSTYQNFSFLNDNLIFSDEKLIWTYNKDNVIGWGGNYYFEKNKLVNITTLGHGKSEDDSWDAEKEVLQNFHDALKDVKYHIEEETKNNKDILVYDFDEDQQPDSFYLLKEDNGIRIAYRLSSQNYFTVTSLNIEAAADQERIQMDEASHSVLLSQSWMRYSNNVAFRYSKKRNDFIVTNYNSESFGNAANDGAGSLHYDLIKDSLEANYTYYDTKLDELISLPTIKYQPGDGIVLLKDFGDTVMSHLQSYEWQTFGEGKTRYLLKDLQPGVDTEIVLNALQVLELSAEKTAIGLITVKYLPYLNKTTAVVIPEINELGENNAFSYDAHILVLDTIAKKVLYQYDEKKYWQSSSAMLKEINVDASPYALNKKTTAFGLVSTYIGNVQKSPLDETFITLFVPDGIGLKKVLNNYTVKEYSGERDGKCAGEFEETKSVINLTEDSNNGYVDLEIKTTTQKIVTVEKRGKCDDKVVDEYTDTKTLTFDGDIYDE